MIKLKWPWPAIKPTTPTPHTRVYQLNLAQLDTAIQRGVKKAAAMEILRQLRAQNPEVSFATNVTTQARIEKADVRVYGVPVQWTDTYILDPPQPQPEDENQ